MERLDKINFEWDHKSVRQWEETDRWDHRYDLLVDYIKEYGAPIIDRPGKESIVVWYKMQKWFLNTNKLEADRIKRLQAVGLVMRNG